MLTSLRAILKGAARSLGVERAAYAALIQEMWPEIVGATAAEHSRPLGLRGGVLLAEAEAGVWTQELSAQRGRYAAEINRLLGAKAVTEIRFRQVPGWTARESPPRDEGTEAGDSDLSAEEIAAVDLAAGEIDDPEVREAARKAMLSQAKWRKRLVRPPGG
ncbi:MAG TPA: DUF721 domain-containing protein [bacterium]|nr:DUF721 domain-containing protein [bacterium]